MLLDSGNLCGHPTPTGTVRTRGLVEGMGKLGYQAANVGERDLSMGYDEFLRRTGKAEFPFISSNIVRKDNGEPVFPPYVILDATTREGKKIRVGVIGVVRFNPIFLKSGPEGSSLGIVHPLETVKRYIDTVRERSDVVILLGALHKRDAQKIIAEVPGIDIAIGSYGGIFSTREEKQGDTLLVYTGNQGKRVGETRLYLDDGNRLDSSRSFLYYLTRQYPADEEMNRFVDGVVKAAGSAGKPTGASPAAAR